MEQDNFAQTAQFRAACPLDSPRTCALLRANIDLVITNIDACLQRIRQLRRYRIQ